MTSLLKKIFWVTPSTTMKSFPSPCILEKRNFIGDGLLAIYAIHAMSLRQRALASDVLGRANAAFKVIGGLMLPVGALISGPLAEWIGVAPTMWIGAGGMLLAAPFLIFSAIARAK